jgi:hypothetical protein
MRQAGATPTLTGSTRQTHGEPAGACGAHGLKINEARASTWSSLE